MEMRLTRAKEIADAPGSFPVALLREAHARLARTLGNGGVRNSERASARLERRLAALSGAISALTNASGE